MARRARCRTAAPRGRLGTLEARGRALQLGGDLACRVETREPLVALTFDNGPTPEGVAVALDALARHHARATFFLIGGAIEANPGLARRLVAAGHELGNHSYRHKRMMGLFATGHAGEIARTGALLRRAGEAPPHLFRPPYGKKLTGLPAALSQAGYRTIMWDVEDPPDGLAKRGLRAVTVSELLAAKP